MDSGFFCVVTLFSTCSMTIQMLMLMSYSGDRREDCFEDIAALLSHRKSDIYSSL